MANRPRTNHAASPLAPHPRPVLAPGEIDFAVLVKSLPVKTQETQAIDVTRFFPELARLYPGVEKVEFLYAKLSAPGLVGLTELGRKIKIQKPDWSDEMLASVALLTSSHVSPPSGAEQLFILYAALVERLDVEDFLALLNEFSEAFPNLSDYLSALSGKKKS